MTTFTRAEFLRLSVFSFGSILVLAACGSSPTSTSTGTPTTNSKQKLTVGTEGTYPPFSFKDLSSGDLAGYDVDVAKEVAKRLGREIEFVPTQWKSMLASLDAKRFDFVANQVSVTSEREKQYAFSEPYTVSGAVVIVSNENPKHIQGIATLKGNTVGTTQGSNFAEYAKKAGANIKFYQGIAQVLSDLEQNRIDAAINDRLYVLTEFKKTRYKVKAVGAPFDKSTSAFAFCKDNTQLQNDVNRALSEMKKDSTLANISKKWFGENVSH